jgi:hypothetical protein
LKIIDYFDEKLSQVGWIRSEIYADCRLWLPETELSPEIQNGLVHYFRSGYEKSVTLGANYYGDTVCLEVWPSQGGSGFSIVLLTAKHSFFSDFMQIFDG